ncbi:hypothetical protein Bbelb_370510 [Branchiostoma belcheri]|nr:hypothetical protein Bbelb_370510 [Branchiostoma belcheri]
MLEKVTKDAHLAIVVRLTGCALDRTDEKNRKKDKSGEHLEEIQGLGSGTSVYTAAAVSTSELRRFTVAPLYICKTTTVHNRRDVDKSQPHKAVTSCSSGTGVCEP